MTRARSRKPAEDAENAPQTDEETEQVQEDQTDADSPSEGGNGDDDKPEGVTELGGTAQKYAGGVAVTDSEGGEVESGEFPEREEEKPDVDYDRNPPPEGKVLKPGDPVRFDGEKVGNMVIVKEDVYREVIPYRSRRPTYLLVYAAGTAIPETALENQGESDDSPEESE